MDEGMKNKSSKMKCMGVGFWLSTLSLSTVCLSVFYYCNKIPGIITYKERKKNGFFWLIVLEVLVHELLVLWLLTYGKAVIMAEAHGGVKLLTSWPGDKRGRGRGHGLQSSLKAHSQ
jgi:hypothetical protein